MSEHNKSSSSDESWHRVALNYEEIDIFLKNIDEAELVGVSSANYNEVEHLSPGTFSSPTFPASSRIDGINIHYMIPLVCHRSGKPNSKAINIWFLVDSGSPFTCLSLKSLEALQGSGNATNAFYSIAIQDQKSNIECRVSKDHYQEVNLLGANAMRRLRLPSIVD